MANDLRLSGSATVPRSESDIRINYNNLNHIIAASNQIASGVGQAQFYSTDGGQTWQQSSLPFTGMDTSHADPAVDWTSDGNAWALTLGLSNMGGSVVVRCYKSTDNGATWAFDSTASGTQTGTDREILWIDHSPTSPYQNQIYATYHNGVPVFFNRRTAGAGAAWQTPIQISGGETTGVGIGGDVKSNTYGDIYVFWQDADGSQKIYVAKSTDGGSTFGSAITVASIFANSRKIAIPADDSRMSRVYISAAAYRTASKNEAYLVWADLSGESGCTSGSGPGSNTGSTCKARIWFARSADGGSTWQKSFMLNNQASLNDQFFPKLALDETSGVIIVIYQDTVNDPGRIKSDVWMQRSSDGGQSWTAAVQISSGQTDETASTADPFNQYGDYTGISGYAGNFFASWTDRRNGAKEEIWGSPITTTDIELIIDKSTFGQDEVDIGLPGVSSFAPALWVGADGFTGQQLGFNQPADLNNPMPNPLPVLSATIDPAQNGSLTPAQIATISANLPNVNVFGPAPVTAIDPTLVTEPQRFLYPFTISFSNDNAFNALNPEQSAIITINASLTVGQIVRTQSANIELTKGEDPYFTDVNPLTPSQSSWLSFDLRFFKVIEGGTRFGVATPMSANPADAPGFISNVLSQLNNPMANLNGDSFDGLSQDETASALEFQQQDDNGKYTFNFAIARVRLKGKTMGAVAKSVRVFFRLFQAQTTSSYFDDQTSYKYSSDGVLNGHKIALLGIQNDPNGNPEYVTIPCFASPRINLSSPADMGMQQDAPNVQDITVNPGIEVDTYFGCWLDINQPEQLFLPLAPPAGNPDGPWNTEFSAGQLHSINESITRAPHQCLVAEIRFDDTPIPTGANYADSDKLAQRNIAWIDGPNPGIEASRRMPHPFEISATAPNATEPDELMILWGNTPQGSMASFYIPALNALDICAMAKNLYPANRLAASDSHTITCPAESVTFLPIPAGSARNAGLLTVTLPSGIRRGDQYQIVVRQLREDQSAGINSPKIGAIKILQQAAQGNFSWKRLLGSFGIKIAISTKENLLFREERFLATLLWIRKFINVQNRWYPVFQRYVEQIGGRVSGFGGDPGKIVASSTGKLPGRLPGWAGASRSPDACYTGKVVGVFYDRFGDFEGFELLTEEGNLHAFKGSEQEIAEIVRVAWIERFVISVVVRQHNETIPVRIILRRGPKKK